MKLGGLLHNVVLKSAYGRHASLLVPKESSLLSNDFKRVDKDRSISSSSICSTRGSLIIIQLTDDTLHQNVKRLNLNLVP